MKNSKDSIKKKYEKLREENINLKSKLTKYHELVTRYENAIRNFGTSLVEIITISRKI